MWRPVTPLSIQRQRRHLSIPCASSRRGSVREIDFYCFCDLQSITSRGGYGRRRRSPSLRGSRTCAPTSAHSGLWRQPAREARKKVACSGHGVRAALTAVLSV